MLDAASTQHEEALSIRSAAAEPGRQRQRRPQIAHNDTRVKAGHHHPAWAEPCLARIGSRLISRSTSGRPGGRFRAELAAPLSVCGRERRLRCPGGPPKTIRAALESVRWSIGSTRSGRSTGPPSAAPDASQSSFADCDERGASFPTLRLLLLRAPLPDSAGNSAPGPWPGGAARLGHHFSLGLDPLPPLARDGLGAVQRYASPSSNRQQIVFALSACSVAPAYGWPRVPLQTGAGTEFCSSSSSAPRPPE
jgi:hypothetical protein